MSFVRWLTFKLVRIFSLLAGFVSFIGGIYAFFFISEPAKLYVTAAGFILGIIFVIISRYYRMKLQNLFFIQEKKKAESKEQPAPTA
jgi:hypothetical protein